VDRRAFISLPGLGALGALLVGCSDYPEQADEPPVRDSQRLVSYGEDPNQVAELYLPDGTPRGVVVVIHGGFWKAEYDRSLGQPLSASLAQAGWVAWNLEYRRVGSTGSGGSSGAPETLDDVAAGIDALADEDFDTSTVITLGHSAGGHLATWAASRGRFDQWQERVPVTAVVSQAGVLDLRAAYDRGLGGGAVEAFLGHPPGPADDPVDPIRQVPLDVPLWCVHGTSDTIVPISQSRSYVAAATAAGAQAKLVEVAGDHLVLIDPDSPAWTRTLEILDTLG
jgi:acetyl esterase/lipase